jgi:segregation and condensation protein A
MVDENLENKEVKNEESVKRVEHPSNLQVYNIVIGRDPSWQGIIYDLISSEQLDPWNIDIATLCRAYFEKIKQLEESNFHISSKMLLAAALLLRIKSEILLNRYIRDIDNILFPKEDDIKKILERIEINEDDIPVLSPKTPLPRFKKVTLQELISALDVAIKTESRRIDKEIAKKQAERLSYVDIPKFRRINIQERIRRFYARLLSGFKHKGQEIKLPYTHFTGNSKEEKIACFLPMLYLSNNGKIWIEQDKHYAEIYLYLYDIFKKSFPQYYSNLIDAPENLEDIPESMMEKFDTEEVEQDLEDAIKNVEETMEESDKQKRVEEINKDFENPLGNLIDSSSEEK